jgi:hypothetical protein
MQKPFQPSPGADVATFDLDCVECLAVKLNVIDFVTRMVRVDCVFLDFETDRLLVSFYPPCSENAIRSRLLNAGYGVKEKEDPVLAIQHGSVQEAISA